ncbi:hypothetical protein [Chroogloeocystis siderophila]|nr:hypothetical protein [Chroogloeocystis siderophila]
MSSIAPTVLIKTDTKGWQDIIQIIAKALAQEDNVQQVIDSYQQ